MKILPKFVCQDVLCLLPVDNKIYAGIGSYLVAFRNGVKKQLKLFDGQQTHLIKVGSSNKTLLVIGGKHIAMVLITNDVMEMQSQWRCDDWILDGVFITDNHVALATSHNQVQLWHHETSCLEAASTLNERCILYSCCLLHASENDVIVLAGTVFSEVLVWLTDLQNPKSSPPILYRLSGHKGVIFSITSGLLGSSKSLVTTSDDRSVRLWSVAGPWDKANISSAPPMFAHTARVWKSLIIQNCVLSIGEDSLLCLWDTNGNLKKKSTLHHSGGILAIAPFEGKIITGGGDGGISEISLISDPLSKALCFTVNPKEIHRKVKFFHGSSPISLTDQGRIMPELAADSELMKCRDMVVSPCRTYVACCTTAGNMIAIHYSKKKTLYPIHIGSQCKAIFWKGDKILVQLNSGHAVLLEAEIADEGAICITKRGEYLVSKSEKLSGSCFICVKDSNELFLVGDRGGTIHLFTMGKSNAIHCQKNVHSNLGVADLIHYRSSILSVGGGGFVREITVSNGEVVVLRSYKIPMESGVRFIEDKLTKKMYVMGFHGVNLIVWDLQESYVVATYNCSGGHRSFDFELNSDHIKFLYIHNHSVRMVNLPLSWKDDILKGFHSKVINCLVPLTNKICVSGSDDNSLKIFEIGDDVKTIHTLETHISSVRDVCAIPKSNSLYLIIAAGGRCQISLTTFDCVSYECVELTSHFLKDTAADGRYMCLDYYKITLDEFLITAGCSDCTIRLFYHNAKNETFSLKSTLHYHRCILKVNIIKTSDALFVIGFATDGCAVFWLVNLEAEGIVGDVRLVQKVQLHTSGINSVFVENDENDYYLLTGGDDNSIVQTRLRYLSKPKQTWEVAFQSSHSQIHSCQITGLCRTDQQHVISTSIDQRMCTYEHSPFSETLKLKAIHNTSVPDVQGVKIVGDKICVFGKGLEVFLIPNT